MSDLVDFKLFGAKMKKYEEIYRKLRDDLTEGSIAYGQKLPSKRTAAELFGASVITIEHSYGLLESEGYIRAKNKSGFYSCYRPGNLIAEKEYSHLPVQQNHTQNHTQKKETFPFSVYARAVRAVLNDYGNAITEKTDGSGAKELKASSKDDTALTLTIEPAECSALPRKPPSCG